MLPRRYKSTVPLAAVFATCPNHDGAPRLVDFSDAYRVMITGFRLRVIMI